MKIGKLAQQTELPIETLRFWEQQGLLSPNTNPHNGYRNYSEKDKQQVIFIQSAKAVGFSLREINDLLALRVDAENYSCHDVKSIALNKLSEIELKISKLEKMRTALKSITDICCGGEEPATECTILNSLNKAGNDL
ncbi:MAG: Zn(2+)-responsive transcriptional regulator [Aquificaceae bacterium]|nr:MAG: Zn(2+)-responsive transcriptional regulator [Aquificaceae bacterium]